ncbi:DUF2304 family protein [Candidatus Uhrbacteria bacterium]|nr:DUF2304 family protein [Candidatus Uhrbacteria bacterium]
MSLIQIFIGLFAAFAITRAVRQFRSGALTILWLFVWVIFWIALAALALTPQIADRVAATLGVGRGVDVLIYIAIIALFYLVFRVFVKIEQVEHEITGLVRKLALEETDEQRSPIKKDSL